ncbi:MAG: pilus assembly protein PilM [Synergistaceae bacterium]|jgi:type IV pilus assembly protein PilM|nr:pilus assembly protein PilM [Synergistaceae bacterium]
MKLFKKKDGGSSAGLFIFGGVMQYVVVSKIDDRSFRLEECIEAPYDVGAGVAELFANQERVEENLKALKKLVGKKWAGKVYAAIQSKDVLIRTVELPQMELADIKDAFRYEFDRFFPIPVDESVYDITFIDRPGRDESTQGAIVNCIASAVRSNTVENLMMACQNVGLKLNAIEPSPVSFLRCLMGPDSPTGFNLYALAGIASSIIIATYRDNGIVYRNTSQSFAVDDPSNKAIANFTRDLQATVNFASTQIRGFSAERLYIGGYGARHSEEIVSSVSDVVNVPVEIVNPWEKWGIFGQPTQLYGWEVSLGLAMRPSEVR